MAADELHGVHDHRHQHGTSAAGVKDPVCRMTIDPHTAKNSLRLRRAHLLFLLRALQGKVYQRARAIPDP